MSKKNNLEVFLASRTGRRFFNFLYSWGAAIVIIGALCKILHFQGGNVMLIVGMITEAVVFFISAFDNSMIAPTEASSSSSNNSFISSGGNSVKSGEIGSVAGGASGKNVNIAPGYSQQIAATASNMDNFATTMDSLNQASLSLLQSYQRIIDSSQGISDSSMGFSQNMQTLNKNVLGLNSVFEAQLQSVNDQIAAVKYINESLDRIKGMYNGAVTDSSAFREETERMTRQITELNNIYARLIQAMKSNNA